MTIQLIDNDQPRADALVDAIEAEIRSGELQPGDRLPSQRALARRLELSVGTITRAYSEAERRGLVVGEVGRGTFVCRSSVHPSLVPMPTSADDIDLGANVTIPVLEVSGPIHRRCLERLSDDLILAIETAPPDYEIRSIDVARRWLALVGIERAAHLVSIAPGFHPALIAIARSLAEPGDGVAAEALAYTGLAGVARTAGVRLEAVELDDGGLDPSSFEEVCRRARPKLLIAQPTHHSPTALTWSDARRREILEIAERHRVLVVEFDEDLALHGHATPLVNIAPDRVIHVSDVGRSLGLGLRLCAVTSSVAAHRNAVERALIDIAWMTSPLAAALTDALITADETGVTPAHPLIRGRADALARRQERVARLGGVGGARLTGARHAHHVWLDLSHTRWTRSEAFVAAAAQRHVIVSDANAFHLSRRPAPNAVRLALGPPSDARLDEALDTLAELLMSAPASSPRYS